MPIKNSVVSKGNACDQRWHAVVARDKKADDEFVYAVRTTGIFCRPSCASRQPKQANVEFFSAPMLAAASGYRPCKRCRPEQKISVHRHYDRVLEACRYIESSQDKPVLKALARQAGMSPYHFQRVFKEIVGLTPKQYEKACREIRIRSQLSRASTVTDAIYEAGFQSSGGFYAEADKVVGMTPGKRQLKGKGETIRFAVGQCSLGAILVAATQLGICTIALGDEPEPLIHDLEKEFSAAQLVANDPAFETVVANVVGLVENPDRTIELPLDIQGTAFQKKVWQVLSSIKIGDTLSYSEVAKLIGSPKAVRAVASACGANRLAVAIPCHRVVGRDGSLSGYRWGIERKRLLLEREQVA